MCNVKVMVHSGELMENYHLTLQFPSALQGTSANNKIHSVNNKMIHDDSDLHMAQW